MTGQNIPPNKENGELKQKKIIRTMLRLAIKTPNRSDDTENDKIYNTLKKGGKWLSKTTNMADNSI